MAKAVINYVLAGLVLLTFLFSSSLGAWASLSNLPRNEGKPLTTKEMRELVGGGMTGNYEEDVKRLVASLRTALDQETKEAQTDAKYKINAFAARYRRPPYEGLESFTTLRTALNTLASYYNNTTARRASLPQKVKERVFMELDRAERALAEGL